MSSSAGARFRSAMQQQNANELPLQIAGTINAYTAMMATQVGHKAIYLSGAGVANASFGLPDLGMTSLDNVLEDARRITDAVDTPLLVDIDTGFGNCKKTIEVFESKGLAGCHLEDQIAEKRCGHLDNKELVSKEEMVKKIKESIKARKDK
ncbi:isocitrate lyase/phosphoenolpyruvate mutase family protein, partial [uncultured Psychrobacter sp.]|uniref:isocitrate lyase/phosphoenolpyruvate mutase family protein n=1 Tax=uncultured Psychrobacter sp. TaxID=259303 RepID=UPI0032B22421